MSFRRTAYGRIGRGSPNSAWIDRWVRTRRGWQLEVLRRKRGAWRVELMPAERVLKTRLFEPTTPHLEVLSTESRRFEIGNLAALSPLVEPRELLGPMMPGATLTDRHAIYVAETETGRVYLPALLLIERLWLWSNEALSAILMPNSLDVLIGQPLSTEYGTEVTLDPRLTSRTPTDAALRRIAWLTQDRQARVSWGSVLTNAYGNRIDLELPSVGIRGWAWGVELPSGLLACELLSFELRCELRDPLPRFRIGRLLHTCPCEPATHRAVSDARTAS